MALTLAKVHEIRSLLAAGLSQRRTAIEARASRGSVANIYHDRWALRLRERIKAREESAVPLSPQESAAVIARARRAAARKAPESIRDLFATHGPPRLELRPDEQAGYIRLRRRLRAERKLAAEENHDPGEAI